MYIFVIDTDSYAGNFEREMTAYITGKSGECGVGQELTDKFPDYFDEDLVISAPDERGCRRPCEIIETPGWFKTGLGGHFKEGQEKEAEEHYVESLKAHDMPQKKMQKHPAYLSVGIFLSRLPTKEETRKIRTRAKMSLGELDLGRDIITGYRLIERNTTEKEIKSWS
jgi:hypothetical protein